MQADGIKGMYRGTRSSGLGAEVKKRILMGTYALSAGHVDAFYKKALQVGLQLAHNSLRPWLAGGLHAVQTQSMLRRCQVQQQSSMQLPA